MSDWTWEYMPDVEHVVGGLPADRVIEVEAIARRLADQAGVKYVGDPPVEESGVSKLMTFTGDGWMVVYQEVWRPRVVFISRAVPWPL